MNDSQRAGLDLNQLRLQAAASPQSLVTSLRHATSDVKAADLQQVAAAVNQQLAAAAVAANCVTSNNQQHLLASAAGALPASSSPAGLTSIDYILSLAVKHQQQQQLMQHQRQLQQLQHLQHLQQLHQAQQEQQQVQQATNNNNSSASKSSLSNPNSTGNSNNQSAATAAAVAAAAAAASAFQQHHLQAAAAAAAAASSSQANSTGLSNHHLSNHQHQATANHQHNSQQQQQQPTGAGLPAHRRAYNPAATLHYMATNECRVIDYRGQRIAAFLSTPNPAMMQHLARHGQPCPKPNQSEFLLCLPQAFEVFLKHLVGGLHTVYTKLKRLDIIPIVCNVEQVRILRGLGAIQPGVNRCKLLSTHDFDILFKDCTTARPGRPPKRSPVGDVLSSASGSPARDELDDEERATAATNTNNPASLNEQAVSSGAGRRQASTSPNALHSLARHQQRNAHGQLQQQNDLAAALANSAANYHLTSSLMAGAEPNSNENTNNSHSNNADNLALAFNASTVQQQLDLSALTQQLGQHFGRPPAQEAPASANQALSSLLGDTGGLLFAAAHNGANQSKSTPPALAASPNQQPASCQTGANPLGLDLGSASGAGAITSTANSNSLTSPDMLNDVWLLLAIVQQQLNQRLQAPASQQQAGGAQSDQQQVLQQQLRAQLAVLQQQQQLAASMQAHQAQAHQGVEPAAKAPAMALDEQRRRRRRRERTRDSASCSSSGAGSSEEDELDERHSTSSPCSYANSNELVSSQAAGANQRRRSSSAPRKPKRPIRPHRQDERARGHSSQSDSDGENDERHRRTSAGKRKSSNTSCSPASASEHDDDRQSARLASDAERSDSERGAKRLKAEEAERAGSHELAQVDEEHEPAHSGADQRRGPAPLADCLTACD